MRQGTVPWRVARAHRAMHKYYENGTLRPKEYERQFAVRDLLADLRHYCDKYHLDFAGEDRSAYNHYLAEKGD